MNNSDLWMEHKVISTSLMNLDLVLKIQKEYMNQDFFGKIEDEYKHIQDVFSAYNLINTFNSTNIRGKNIKMIVLPYEDIDNNLIFKTPIIIDDIINDEIPKGFDIYTYRKGDMDHIKNFLKKTYDINYVPVLLIKVEKKKP